MTDSNVFQGHAGCYKVTDALPFAYGRASVLYKAVDEKGADVCLKRFRNTPGPGAVTQFMQELTAQSKLKHPNILPVTDFGTVDPNIPFLVLPLCQGGNLRELISGRAFLPMNEAILVLKQIALAIDFAHQSGFVHGDIKPENILFLLGDTSHACLTDFGISKYFAFEERITTKVAGEFGSTLYLSPEQIGENVQSPKSDIYSFALVATELLTGKPPFDLNAPAFRQMTDKVLGGLIEPIKLNPLLKAETNAALLQGLSVNRDLRPNTATEFCEMLTGSNKPSVAPTANVPPANSKHGFWSSLDAGNRIALLTALIAAIAGVLTAALKIVPEFLKR